MPDPDSRDPGRTMLFLLVIVVVIGGAIAIFLGLAGKGLAEVVSH